MRLEKFQEPKILVPWDFLENSKAPMSTKNCSGGPIELFWVQLYPQVATKWYKTLSFGRKICSFFKNHDFQVDFSSTAGHYMSKKFSESG